MTGSLMPSVPTKFLVKFNPPKITLIYYFEYKEHDQYYHEIPIDKKMIEGCDNEEITSHLFVSEAFYFNPK